MPFDISSTTPAAPGGRTLVTWLSDGSANISGSVPTPPGTALEPAHDVYAGPTSGPDALPTFRLLVAGDIPAIPESGVTSLVSDLALKAPLASPALSGTPTAPTASTPTNTTQIATTAFVKAQGYGSGTVTSVALTVPAEFSVAGSPISTSGTLAVTKANQSANLVFAGPASGGAAAPTFRALVAADIPFPITIGWMIGSGVTGTNVGKRLVAPRAGQITGAEIVIDASDGSTDLTFDIKKNGTSIFTSARTITHGASAGAVTDLTSALSSNPTTVAKGDVFTIDISSGTSTWQFTVAAG